LIEDAPETGRGMERMPGERGRGWWDG